MAVPYTAGMPDELDLGGGWTLRVTAVNPTTGAAISAITVSNLAILLNPLGETAPGDLAVGPYLLVPGPSG